MEVTTQNPNQRPSMGLVFVAAIALLAVGCVMTLDGFFPPELGSRPSRLIYMTVEIVSGLYIVSVGIGLAARFEWARLSAIWVGALFSPFYVIRLLVVSEGLVTKTRDFKFTETVPNFFLLCLAAVAVSTLVVTTLTSHSGRAVFPHVTDRERTDWLGLTCLNICVGLNLVVMINYAANRYYTRFDVTQAAFYNLADRTKSFLQNVREPVDVIVYYNSATEMKEHLTNLLSEFKRFCPNLRVEYVDPFRMPDRSEEVRQRYNIGEENMIVFAVGSGETMRRKYVSDRELAEYEIVPETYFEESRQRMMNFKAEGAFVSALQNVLQEKQPKVYFLTGHGERDPASPDPFRGFADVAVELRRENLLIEKLNLAVTNEIPTDCDLLIVAGPSGAIPSDEIKLLRDYMKRGGRMLVMLDALTPHPMKPLLEEWDVKANDDVIVHGNHRIAILPGVERVGPAPFAEVLHYGNHPIVEHMTGFNTRFPLARSLAPVQAQAQSEPNRPRVTELARTPSAPDFWGETNANVEGDNPHYNEGVDLPGPLTVAVAVEAAPDANGQSNGRMVVIGSSIFLTSRNFTANNVNFFLNAVNWLLRRPEMIGIVPKTPNEYAVRMTAREIFWTKLAVIVGLPGMIALLGIIMWFARRK